MTTKLLHEEVQQAAEELRRALRVLIEEAGCNPLKPQAVHRHIGVDRVLCWKVSRMIRADRVEEALVQLPGEEALSIFIVAFERTTASATHIDKARTAVAGLNQAIANHVGDRRTLHLMLDSVPGGQDALAQSRKLLFRGASGLWGIQARERVHIALMAPNPENPEMVDSLIVSGWVNVTRMRPDARWRMMKFASRPDGEPGPAVEAISRQVENATQMGRSVLLPEFCEDMPPVNQQVETDGYTYFEIGASATGRVGAFSVLLGAIQRSAGSRYASQGNDSVEFWVNILAPTEHMTFDVFVHRDLRMQENADIAFFSAAFNQGTHFSDFNRMPIEPEGVELEGAAMLENRHYPRQRELLDFVFERMGWRFDDFTATRYDVDYPPFPSVAVYKAPLDSVERFAKRFVF